MDYLRWYRKVIDVPIENETELLDLAGDAETVLLTLRSASGTRRIAARRLVLANGRDGLGGAYVPELFRGVDRGYCAHSSDDIDFAALADKTVAVIGAGASAVDNAAEALEAGATRVAMLIRRPDVPRINKGMGIGSPGLWVGFERLTLAAYSRAEEIARARGIILADTKFEFGRRRASGTQDAKSAGASGEATIVLANTAIL